MAAASTQTEIDRLAQRRQELWAEEPGTCGPEVDRLTDRLHDLYEVKRHDLCHAATGTRRADIVRRARVESELERLMTERRGKHVGEKD